MSKKTVEKPQEMGVITPALKGIFGALQYLFPGKYVFSTRVALDQEAERTADPEAERYRLTVIRARRVDYYILAWLMIEIVCVLVAAAWPGTCPAHFVALLAAYHVAELLQEAIK